jgi:hypothetical protein
MENMRDIKKVLESQGNTHNMVEVQANSECRSLTLSPTRSSGPPCLEIDIQDASDLRFGGFTYVWKDKEIHFPMSLLSWSTKIRVSQNRRNKKNSRTFLVLPPTILGRWPMYQVRVH